MADLLTMTSKTNTDKQKALDSALYQCQWHRVLLDATLPPLTQIRVRTFGAEIKHPDQRIANLDDDAWDTNQTLTAEGSGHNPDSLGVLEAFVEFRCEVSVLVARSLKGQIQTYPAVENQHRNQILDQTIVPARVSPAVAERAEAIGRRLAEALGLVGLIAVEMFVTQDDEVLVNELAPRPHNSGHWTLDGCVTSQFEQFIRAVAGLPLGSVQRHGKAVMRNLLGDEVEDWPKILAEPGAKLHLYGKAEARPGRKMGHVTRLIQED